MDRVLHNRGEVSEVTRRQIMKIVEDLGYTPNLLAKSLASKKVYRIAVILPDSENESPYWEKPLAGIRQAYDEIKDFNASVEVTTFDLNSEISFKKAFNKVLNSKPDGIVLTPVFYNASFDFIHRCEEVNLPYVFIDVQIEGCGNLAYFGQDSGQSGFLAAKLMHYSLPADSLVLLLKLVNKGGVSHHLKLREMGFLKFFSGANNFKGIQTKSIEVNFTDFTLLNKILSDEISDSPSLNGIFVTNSKVFAVAEWLEENCRKQLLLIGYDLINNNLDYLERGTIDFLIGQKPEEQGYKSILALFNHLMSGKEVQKINYSPIDIIMKENIDYYKNFKI